jgi:hypothetical protein
MEPNSFGRKLGIGVRVGANILRDRAGRAAESTAESVKRDAPVYAARGKNVGHGAKRFGQAVWGPLAHAGGVLWLEITGLFFAIFALFFAQNAWKLRHAVTSADHRRLLTYLIVTVVFAWFTFSSFYRARRKSRQKAAANR